jgi:signal transduction histidine kinase
VFGVLCALDSVPSQLDESVSGLFTLLADLIAFELEADEREQAQAAVVEDVRQTAEQRDRFLAAVAHDLRNPLTVIRGHAELIRRTADRGGPIPPQRVLSSIDTIHKMTDRMQVAIGEVLDLTHMQLNRSLDLHRTSVDLARLVREVVAQQAQTSRRHQVQVEGLASLVGGWDQARLARVVQNLIGNAVRYSPDGGTVTVTIAERSGPAGELAVVQVADHGLGIPEADLPRIFEQFHRGGNVVDRIDGTGIGLFSVRQIVEQHGGSVTVESREGAGTTFTVILPR